MLFNQIALNFERPVSSKLLDSTNDALETLTSWNGQPGYVSGECYDLCRRIVGSSTVEERMKWRASRLVMQIGFRHPPSWPPADEYAGWPVTGLKFLEHQFALEPLDYDSIADVLTALQYRLSGEATIPWTKTFVVGMVASLQVDKPTRLRAAIIRFIHRFGHQVLNQGVQAMSEEQKQSFFAAMLSKVDMEGREYYSKGILTYAIMSSASRPCLDLDHLTLLESMISRTVYLLDAAIEGLNDAWLIPALADKNLLDGAILKLCEDTLVVHAP
jgi:hypothetical protein